MANVILEILDGFLFGMRPDVPVFRVLVFTSDFKC